MTPDIIPCRLLLCNKGELLLTAGNSLPEEEGKATDDSFTFIMHGRRYSARMATGSEREELKGVPLRETYDLLDETDYLAAQKGMELLYWHSRSRFCGICGAPMRRTGSISKVCTGCGTEIFPHVSPAIIVLIRRGRQALLVHARTFTKPFFGLVAGFVETGESLEECVAREIQEETALRVRDIRYFGSQAWGYPSNIMIGFTAEYDGGELRFADNELTDGGFFDPGHLPPLPGYPSIARRMIDAWVAACGCES